MWPLENSYREQLPEQFYDEQNPKLVQQPQLVLFNEALAEQLHLPESFLESEIAQYLSGNQVLPTSTPIAQAYAGHQFGHFNLLGDGRAILLGEHLYEHHRVDVQLKGAGATKYSRRGDGRATLYSMLREYLISEAMHHLSIPTTRSLAVVKTGEPVYRETTQEGAVLTRIAQSHIRVGTFEFARAYGSPEHIQSLLSYTIKRHYPFIKKEENQAVSFFKAVLSHQIDLIVNWMRVGFIHGVMNTDNMSIPGETIDYGPCAFMNTYHPETVFSSIDRESRYAYGNQPHIAHWNLTVLANALLPLVDPDKEKAVELLQEILNEFPTKYQQKYYDMMSKKLGILKDQSENKSLVDDLLKLMTLHKVDYTNFFIVLMNNSLHEASFMQGNTSFQAWYSQWEVLFSKNENETKGREVMRKYNPTIIPRNHLVEETLTEATLGNWKTFETFLEQLQDPYSPTHILQEVPASYDQQYQTFCGT